MTLTEQLVAAVVEQAVSLDAMPSCTHGGTGDPFTALILEDKRRLCPNCFTHKVRYNAQCSLCFVPMDCIIQDYRMDITLTFERSSGKDARDKFIAPLCQSCAEGVPEGVVGTFLTLAKMEDGRTVFLAYKRSATKEKL